VAQSPAKYCIRAWTGETVAAVLGPVFGRRMCVGAVARCRLVLVRGSGQRRHPIGMMRQARGGDAIAP
jgi:hypothetical protein